MKCPHCQQSISSEQCSSTGDGPAISTQNSLHVSDEVATSKAAPIARAVRWGVLVLLCGAASLVIWQAGARSRARSIAQAPPKQFDAPAASSMVVAASSGVTNSDRAVFEPPVNGASQTAAAIPTASIALVQIEAGGAGRETVLGAGFLIGDGLHVATNHHVVANATAARVRFANGWTYDVTGYASLDAKRDLAILAIAGAPPGAQPAVLDKQPPATGEAVVAHGHPGGESFAATSGRVTRLVATADLPASSLQFVRRAIGGGADDQWIQHTAPLRGGSSGGPLLNEAARVVGVNTWVDQQSGLGYAVEAAPLQEMLDRLNGQTWPLAEEALTSSASRQWLNEASAEHFAELREAAIAMRWTPTDAADYQTLRQLAWLLTFSSTATHDTSFASLPTATRDELADEADAVIAAMARHDWSDPIAMTLMNEFARSAVHDAGQGVVMFAKVLRLVTHPEGGRGAIMEIVGVDQFVYVPLDSVLARPEPATVLAVLGVVSTSPAMRFGPNPLALEQAPVVMIAEGGMLKAERPATALSTGNE